MKTIRVILMFTLVVALMCASGCKRPQAMKDADAVRRNAIAAYATNTTLIESSLASAYRDSEMARADMLYDWDLAKLDKAAGPDGKIAAADAIKFIQRINEARKINRDKIDAKLVQLNTALEASKRDLVSFLRLDDLAQQWQDAGIDPSMVQQSLQSILSITKIGSSPAPAKAEIVPLQ